MSPNIVTSKLSVSERWLKLYRKIHNLFIKNELVHILDYQNTIGQLNARIAALESHYNAELKAIKLMHNTHVHLYSPGPSAPVPSAPPTVQAIDTPPLVTPVTTTPTAAMAQYDAVLQGTGPATAPLGDGLSIEAQKATIQARSDVGI